MKPCPFCDSPTAYPRRVGVGGDAAWCVECLDCGARGPAVRIKFEVDPELTASERWDVRAAVTATDAE